MLESSYWYTEMTSHKLATIIVHKHLILAWKPQWLLLEDIVLCTITRTHSSFCRNSVGWDLKWLLPLNLWYSIRLSKVLTFFASEIKWILDAVALRLCYRHLVLEGHLLTQWNIFLDVHKSYMILKLKLTNIFCVLYTRCQFWKHHY